MTIKVINDVLSFLELAEELGFTTVSTRSGYLATLGNKTVGYWNSYSGNGKILTSDFSKGLDISTVPSRFSSHNVQDISILN